MTARDIDAAVAALAAQQTGCFNRRQVLAAGGTARHIDTRIGSGAWERAGPGGVYVLPGSPDAPTRRLWIPHLGIQGPTAVAFESAAELHGVRSVPSGRSTLLVPHGREPRPHGATVHQTRVPWPPPLSTVLGLPVTTLPETVTALAGVYGPARMSRVVDEVLVKRMATIGELGARLTTVRRRGKPGVRMLAALLDARLLGEAPAASELERMLFAAFDLAGIVAVRQFPHPGRDLPGRCVDAADPPARMLVEADGRAWHQRIDDVKRDHHRDNEALRAGWVTIRFLWEDLVADLEGAAQLLLDTRAVRLAS